jgi:NADPH:quinone reductase-like Zn-dependent oxidoreductase
MSNGPTMKVLRYHPPGGPDKLHYAEEPIPSDLKHGEMLIRVAAVGIIWTELYWPIYQKQDGSYITHIPGHDFSGTVEKTGPGFEGSEIQVGSEVIAFTSKRQSEGALAEYAKSDLTQTVLKPKSLSLVDAASLPLSALTAWQALFDHANLKARQRLLVTGAAGGTGIWAVQMGKMVGAYIIGTASSQRSFELLKSFGIDEIVDYKTAQLDEVVKDIDVVLDTVGGTALDQSLKTLKKGGMLININDPSCADKAKPLGVSGTFFIVSMNTEQMSKINRLIDNGTLRTVVDSVFSFAEARKAYDKGASGNVHGKIVVKVADEVLL